MDYVIKIGKNYIGVDGSGRYTEVTNLSDATRGPVHKLSNLVNNCVTPTKRSKCKIVAEDAVAVKARVVPHATAIAPNHTLFDEVFAQLKTIDGANFDKTQNDIAQQLSEIDKEITDIQHYIEFNKLNAAEGYQAYKMLQDKLLKRRVIKDNHIKFQMLASAKVSDIFDGTLEKNIDALDKRVYTPRVLTDLF